MAGEAIIFEVGADSRNFVREMGRVKDYARTTSAEVENSLGGIGGIGGKSGGMRLGEFFKRGVAGAGALVAGLVAVRAVMEGVAEAAERLGHIQDLSDRTGLSPEFLQKLGRAADRSGTSVDAIAKATAKFAKELMNSDGADAFAKNLEAIGLSVEDLKGLGPEELFTKVAQAVGGIEDPVARSAAAMNVFGKSGAELVPVLGDIDHALQSVGGLTAEQVARVDELGDAWSDLKNDFMDAAGALLSDFAPAATETVKILRHMFASLSGVTILAKELAAGKSFEEAYKNANDFVNSKLTEIYSAPKPRTSGDPDIAGDSSGASRAGGVGSAPKDDPTKTAAEKAWDAYQSDPTKIKNGRFRTPGEARRMKRDAEKSRRNADRANTSLGGHVGNSPNNHPDATNLAQAQSGFFNAFKNEGGIGLSVGGNPKTANDLAKDLGFYGGHEKDVKITTPDPSNPSGPGAPGAAEQPSKSDENLAAIRQLLDRWDR